MAWGEWGLNSDRHLLNQGRIVRSTLGRPRIENLILHLVTYSSENCRWRLDEGLVNARPRGYEGITVPRKSPKKLVLLMKICRKDEPMLYDDDYCGSGKAKLEGMVASGGQPPTSRAGQYLSRSSI